MLFNYVNNGVRIGNNRGTLVSSKSTNICYHFHENYLPAI